MNKSFTLDRQVKARTDPYQATSKSIFKYGNNMSTTSILSSTDTTLAPSCLTPLAFHSDWLEHPVGRV